MSTVNDIGSAKHESPTGASAPKYPIEDACAYLRSALHYLAKSGVDIGLENVSGGALNIRLERIYWYEGKRAGDIFFAPIPNQVGGVPDSQGTPPDK